MSSLGYHQGRLPVALIASFPAHQPQVERHTPDLKIREGPVFKFDLALLSFIDPNQTHIFSRVEGCGFSFGPGSTKDGIFTSRREILRHWFHGNGGNFA